MKLNVLLDGTLLNNFMPITYDKMIIGIESGYFRPTVGDIMQCHKDEAFGVKEKLGQVIINEIYYDFNEDSLDVSIEIWEGRDD